MNVKRRPWLRETETTVAEVALTEEELWALHDAVRQHDRQGEEWDREVMAGMMAALLAAQSSAGSPGRLTVDGGDLWQIDRQVRSDMPVGDRQARDRLSPTVIRALLTLEENDNGEQHASPGSNASKISSGGAPAPAAS